jgi:hypothetical protein
MKLDFPKPTPSRITSKLNTTFTGDGGGGDAALIQFVYTELTNRKNLQTQSRSCEANEG